MAALFVSQAFYHCAYSLSSPSLTMHLIIRIWMLLISSFLRWFSFAFLSLVCHPVSLNLLFSCSLCLFSPVWPGPGHPHPQCMYYYLSFFFISHHINFLPLLAALHHSSRMWMLTQRWFFWLPGDIFPCYILKSLRHTIQIKWSKVISHSFLLCCSYNRNKTQDWFSY